MSPCKTAGRQVFLWYQSHNRSHSRQVMTLTSFWNRLTGIRLDRCGSRTHMHPTKPDGCLCGPKGVELLSVGFALLAGQTGC